MKLSSIGRAAILSVLAAASPAAAQQFTVLKCAYVDSPSVISFYRIGDRHYAGWMRDNHSWTSNFCDLAGSACSTSIMRYAFVLKLAGGTERFVTVDRSTGKMEVTRTDSEGNIEDSTLLCEPADDPALTPPPRPKF